MSKYKICIACNEDGFGPSAFAYHLVNGIINEFRNEVMIFVFNNSAYKFNRSIYSKQKFLGKVYPINLNRDSLIKLEKPNGEVAVKETIKKLLDYDSVKKHYLNEIRQYLYDADVAIDIGVPLFVYSSKMLGIENRITFFDHSWAKTLKLICHSDWHRLYKFNPKPTDMDQKVAEIISNFINKDEMDTKKVYIFDEYITPKEFLDYWTVFGCFEVLKKVLGKSDDKYSARKKLNEMLLELGQKEVPEDKNLVLISPGGTAVWADLIPTIVDQFIIAEEKDYILVLSNPKAIDEKETSVLKAKIKNSDRIRYFEFVKGGTQQIIMPAFKLIVTRAGGGTVNDALASNIPFICIEEPQVQVELIRQTCINKGLTLDLEGTAIDKFKECPIECIDEFYNARKPPSASNVKYGFEAEKDVVNYIKKIL